MKQIDFYSDAIFHELRFLEGDEGLIRAARACVEFHRRAHTGFLRRFAPNPQAIGEVSEEALQKILESGKTVHGIRTEREISNVIVFNLPMVEGSIASDGAHELRKQLDRVVRKKIEEIFGIQDLSVIDSGHFWYPPGGYMGWHTNFKVPGWRLYVTYAKEPGKSFFRYRDPESGEVVTSWDKEWNFRLFRVFSPKPFWHAIYSETDRFSFGYNINVKPAPTFSERLLKKAGKIFEKVGFS